MNENARRWVEALRSGEYAQTRGALRRLVPSEDGPVGYCCLGVACAAYMQHGGRLDVGSTDGELQAFNGGSRFLPDEVRDWLGLCEYDGRFASAYSLTERNDGGATFDQIADLIESEPEGLFVATEGE